MRIYRWKSDLKNYRLLDCDDEAITYLHQCEFDGRTLGETWEPFEVWWDSASEGEASDFPGFPEPVVSGRVVEALGDILSLHGELLELRSEDGDFFLYNVTEFSDCLDEDSSSGKRLADGRFIWIHRHVFKAPAAGWSSVFRIPQWSRGSNIYVTEDFTQSVEASGLHGLGAVEVWDERVGSTWFPMF